MCTRKRIVNSVVSLISFLTDLVEVKIHKYLYNALLYQISATTVCTFLHRANIIQQKDPEILWMFLMLFRYRFCRAGITESWVEQERILCY